MSYFDKQKPTSTLIEVSAVVGNVSIDESCLQCLCQVMSRSVVAQTRAPSAVLCCAAQADEQGRTGDDLG